ncbi:MAG: Two-component response regulator [Myxococcaceae bacterium]|nr:Two-component response regulator [Myxococcaceae bacterium]
MEIAKRRPAVLIVDDDFDLREAVADLLQDDGFEVLSAKTGREALLEMATRPVKLVLLDLNMPGMDGRAFRKAQLADASIASIPIFVISGSEDIAATAAALGASAAFQKPFSVDALLDAVERYR